MGEVWGLPVFCIAEAQKTAAGTYPKGYSGREGSAKNWGSIQGKGMLLYSAS